jgi:hypothetical protein
LGVHRRGLQEKSGRAGQNGDAERRVAKGVSGGSGCRSSGASRTVELVGLTGTGSSPIKSKQKYARWCDDRNQLHRAKGAPEQVAARKAAVAKEIGDLSKMRGEFDRRSRAEQSKVEESWRERKFGCISARLAANRRHGSDVAFMSVREALIRARQSRFVNEEFASQDRLSQLKAVRHRLTASRVV